MQLFYEVNNIGILVCIISFIFFSWKYFLKFYNYNKIFDFVFMFILFGYGLERVMFALINREDLLQLGWSRTVSFEHLPLVLLDLDKAPGFSLILFLVGGLFGLFLYNGLNTINKVDFEVLENILRIFCMSLIPWIIFSIVAVFDADTEQDTLADLLPWLIRLLFVVFVIGIYKIKHAFWKNKPGFFAGLVILLFAITGIFIDYIDPNFTPTVINLFSTNQVFAIFLIILAINVFLTAVSDIQDSIIRKKFIPTKQIPSRGFALSFANKRRISNPLNIRLKNLTKNSGRIKRGRES